MRKSKRLDKIPPYLFVKIEEKKAELVKNGVDAWDSNPVTKGFFGFCGEAAFTSSMTKIVATNTVPVLDHIFFCSLIKNNIR